MSKTMKFISLKINGIIKIIKYKECPNVSIFIHSSSNNGLIINQEISFFFNITCL